MITRMSAKLSSFFAENGVIEKEDIEVYDYSLQILLSTVINFAAVIALAIVTRTVLFSAVFLLGFIPLRLMAGGYHAKNHLRCFLILIGTYAAFATGILFIPERLLVILTASAAVISILLIFLLAPVEDKNKPLSEDEKKSYKRKSRMALTMFVVADMALLVGLQNKKIAFSLALGAFAVAFSLLASLLRNSISKRIHNA